MAEPNNSLTAFDQFLRVWAILGPILAAGAAAWWNRKNELDNRNFNKLREDENENCRNKKFNQDKIIEFRNNQNFEIKKYLLSFVSTAGDCHNAAITTSLKPISNLSVISQLVEEHTKRIRILSDSFNELFLLSPPHEVLDNSLKLLNFISNTPFQKYQDHSLHQTLSKDFSNIKTEVLVSAKIFTAKQNTEFIKSLEY